MPLRFLLPLLLILAAPLTLHAGDGPSPLAMFGRMHVVLVHFPAALLIVLALIEALRWRRREGTMDTTLALVAVISAGTSVVAAVQGWMLAGDGGGGESTYAVALERHRWLGVSTAVLAVAVALLALRRQLGDSAGLTLVYRALLLPSAVVVCLTGHYGGVMVHGPDYLPMPWESPEVTAADPAGDTPIPEKIDFWRDVEPIFAKSCYECHNDKEQKGDLRMDSREFQLAGGEGGPSIIPGDSTKSLTMIRIRGEGDDPRMPKKKPPLSERQTAIIARWIDQGAEWPAKP
jgi:uncharacterized membrane protein